MTVQTVILCFIKKEPAPELARDGLFWCGVMAGASGIGPRSFLAPPPDTFYEYFDFVGVFSHESSKLCKAVKTLYDGTRVSA